MLPWREYKSPCVDFIIRFAAFTLEFKELKALRRFGTSAKFLRISAFAAFALRECYNSSHRLSGILRRVLPLWRLLYQASFRWQSLRWVLSSANEVKKFVVESERCPEDGYQKCEKLVTCIHQEAESNEQNELNQVEVAPHQNGKSDMSDVDLVGHTETWCSTVNLASFLGCLKTTLRHLETVSLVYWSCWGCGNVRCEILFSWFRSYALWDVGLWNILSVTGDVMKAIHCGSLCASLCLHAAASSHRSDHYGNDVRITFQKDMPICQPRCMTPWDSMSHVEHKKTSSHIQPQLQLFAKAKKRLWWGQRSAGLKGRICATSVWWQEANQWSTGPLLGIMVSPKSLKLKIRKLCSFPGLAQLLGWRKFFQSSRGWLHFWESLPRSGRCWAYGGNDNVVCSGYDILWMDIPWYSTVFQLNNFRVLAGDSPFCTCTCTGVCFCGGLSFEIHVFVFLAKTTPDWEIHTDKWYL